MTPLHAIGEFFRRLALAVPLPAVRVLFLALLVGVLVWMLLRRPDADEDARRFRTLQIWAAAALLIQVVIYSFL